MRPTIFLTLSIMLSLASCVSIKFDVIKLSDNTSAYHDSNFSTGDVTKIVIYNEDTGKFEPAQTGSNNDKLVESLSQGLKVAAEVAKAMAGTP